MNLQELLQKRAGLIENQKKMLETLKNEKRNFTVDEYANFQNLETALDDLDKTIEAEKKFNERVKTLESQHYTEVNLDEEVKKTPENSNFSNFGEMLVAVARAGSPTGRFPGAGQIDNRLSFLNAASGHSANVPSDGGFLISATRSNEIMQKMYEGGTILADCKVYDIGDYSDSLEVPYVDETSRANGSRWGGLRAYREGEVDAPTSTKTKLGLWECKVTDMKALCYVTDRLLNDAPALESLIMDQMPEEFTFKTEDELLNGTGGIQCKGVIGDPATVSIAKETGQAATTLLFENVINMWSRCFGRSRAGANWYHNQDIEPQLFAMAFNAGTGGVPVFMPPSGLSVNPYATLLGRPLKPVEQAQTLGTVGDIILGNFKEYAIVRKGGLKSAASIHVRFIYDEMTFKFNMRLNGKPKWKSTLTPFKGSNTLAPFVTLATR
jgi:HK97 family phage major capsid protein